MADPFAFTVTGVEPRDPAFARAPATVRRAFWAAVIPLAQRAYHHQLEAGIGANGEDLTGLARSTRLHRRSARTRRPDPSAPPFIPAHALSRTNSLLRGRVLETLDGVEMYWLVDRTTGLNWGRVIAWHKDGSKRYPPRNVLGLAPQFVLEVQAGAAHWWAVRQGTPGALAAAKNPLAVTQFALGGQKYTLGASSGPVSVAALNAAIRAGTFRGFHRAGGSPPLQPVKPQPPPQPRHPALGRPGIRTNEQLAAEARAKAEAMRLKAEEEARRRAGAPILPDRPIAERIKVYTAGDEKIRKILDLDLERQKEDADLAIRRSDLNRQINAQMDRRDKAMERATTEKFGSKAWTNWVDEASRIESEMAPLVDERDKIKAEQKVIHDRLKDRILKLLEVPDAIRIDILGGKANDPSEARIEPLNTNGRDRLDEATSWYHKIFRRESPTPAAFEAGTIPAAREQRSYWAYDRFLALSQKASATTAVHEIGHAIEDTLSASVPAKKVLDRSLEFLNYRVGSEPLVKLKDAIPGSTYDDWEKGRKDHFDRAFSTREAYYCGKDYGKRGTEILSMGFQKLFEDPVQFARYDPEYLKYCLGILDGSLR